MKEIWKIIDGYDNYAVSNLGQIKRLAHYTTSAIWNSQIGPRFYKERILTKFIYSGSRRSYKYITLTDSNGKQKLLSVHRLVAQAFIPNPNNLPEVDHINFDTFDNRVENLRWVTSKENKMHKPSSSKGYHRTYAD